MPHATTPSPALAHCPADLMRLLGHLYLRHGHSAHAAVLFDALHKLDPLDALAARSLAYSRLQEGRPEEALAPLQRLLDHGDGHAVTHVLHAQALLALGRTADSARAMRAYVAARAVPTHPERP
ncbi:tetratricopeptide repeat protein [Rhizobacter sp. SG703]|uniref:type III secretion apparatus assembly chaperone SctY n=1 Tax=Rhizobacter sp. SG703 TaxID=2587140 RepID=UPI001446BB4C|nr:tetratricopeptide repeat protein [Rhizobacter sp. SG703]NKI94075.1 putative Zn-dependent protease [Rhizobacter sp. SG703]